MTDTRKSKALSAMFTDERNLAWMEEHLGELRQYASGKRILYQSLTIAFVVGLAAQIGGYALITSVQGGLPGLLADLLHALGWSLWTGVVVALFVEVIPEVKRGQIKQAVEAYETVRREKEQARGTQPKRAGRRANRHIRTGR